MSVASKRRVGIVLEPIDRRDDDNHHRHHQRRPRSILLVGAALVVSTAVLLTLQGSLYWSRLRPFSLASGNALPWIRDIGMDRDDASAALAKSNGSSTQREYATGNADSHSVEGKMQPDSFHSKDSDRECPFRDSPLYRKVFVYPDYHSCDWKGPILSEAGSNGTSLEWPWLAIDREIRANGTSHYDIDSEFVQYTTELLVRELFTNPRSCLRTYDPDQASLFYVPYLCSVEHHMGKPNVNHVNRSTSLFGRAIMDILEKQSYEKWETVWGFTSKYWRRRQGSDHVLVFSEPLHGLWHPSGKRGNFNYIRSQMQLHPPIVVSVELSTTFVQMYPKCSAKNILLPYPNVDGRWFNGFYDRQVERMRADNQLDALSSEAALVAEKELATSSNCTGSCWGARPVAQYYWARHHGTCKELRDTMTYNFVSCSKSYKVLWSDLKSFDNANNMRLATFCPCPGGDSPSAKRFFDAVLAGCIPVVISWDFVWPFTMEADSISYDFNSSEFSLRLNADLYSQRLLHGSCIASNSSLPAGVQGTLENISINDIVRMREGLEKARKLYSWYRPNLTLPIDPLRQGILPDGGVAYSLVNALAERAEGIRWSDCERELSDSPTEARVRQFKC